MESRPLKRKKKRKNDIAKAKRYGKLGWFGRGTHVDEDTYQYFLGIHELNIDKCQDPDEKATLADNALEQTVNKEVDLARNQLISKVIEKLIPFASDENIERFISAFIDLRVLCTDSFSSHVVQTLVKVCAQRFRDKGSIPFQSFVLKVSSFVFNNLEEFIYDSYANHVGRTCLEECSGSPESPGLSEELVKNVATRMVQWPDIKDLPGNPLTSGFLQTLLLHLSKINLKITKKIAKVLLPENYFICCENIKLNEIPPFFEDMPLTRLLETMIEVSKGKYFTKIYLNIFKGRLKVLSCNNSSFIAVEKLLVNVADPYEFSSIVDEIISSIPEILQARQFKVLLSVAKACVKFGSKEGEFLKGLKEALGIKNNNDKDFIEKIIYTQLENHIKKIDFYGSLLIQTLFLFKKPILVIESLLAFDTNDLLAIFNDPKGSHIVDAFVASNTVGEKSRNRLILRLKDHFKDLAMDKFGSRVIDAFWTKATAKEKHIIMGSLDRSITRTKHGCLIGSKYRIDLYLSDKVKWEKTLSLTSTTKLSKFLKE